MTRALIIGGGVAGAATALGLQQIGIEATIYEAHPTGAGNLGAFLMVMRNGLDALQALHAHGPVADVSFPATTVDYRDSTNAQLTRNTLGGDSTDANRPRTLTRPALYGALHAELGRRGISIEHGKRLTNTTRTGDGRVTAAFDDGTHTTGDMLIGADGIHSTVRTLLDPRAPQPRETGQILVFGSTRTPPPAPTETYRMIYGNRGFFGHTTAPDGETFWFAQLADAPETADLTGTPLRDRIRAVYASDHTDAAHLIDATTHPLATRIYHLDPVTTWHDTTSIVIGDAAHAASPAAAQGASLALEDAVTLAKCLRDLPTQHDAFRAYTQLRHPRVARLAADSADQAAHQTPAPDRENPARHSPTTESRSWLYHHHIDWHETIPSPSPTNQR